MGAEGSAFQPPCARSSLLDSFDVCLAAKAFPQGHSLLYNFNDFAASFLLPLSVFFFKSTEFLSASTELWGFKI